MAKSDNLLSVLWLLHSRGRLTAAQLAAELETSVRTVYRYIDSLCASGVPIVSDSGHDGGFWLTEGFRGTPLFFEANEVSAIFHATKFAQHSGYPYSDVLDGALTKLQRTLTPNQSAHLEKHVSAFGVVQNLRGGGSIERWLGTLEASVAECQTLEVLYHKLDSDKPEWRRVDPYGLVFSSGVWYIAVYCHTRQAMRDFRVDRIEDVRVTTDVFERPNDFSVSHHFSDERLIRWIQSEPHLIARVTGRAHALSPLCDHWFLRHCVVDQQRTHLSLRVPRASLTEVAKYLIPYGDAIQVEEPAELRSKMADICRAWGNHFSVQ